MKALARLSILLILLAGCSTPKVKHADTRDWIPGSSVFGPAKGFIGSPFPDIGRKGLFPVRTSHIAILSNGDVAFTARMQTLKKADTSIRIQALIFNGDEAGLAIARLLKQKKRQGLDVRVIVDAFSNPSLQTQRLYFDLKQWGIEVEGYEAMLLQWINEVPIPKLMPHYDPNRLDKRFHEKMWIIDGETDHGIAITGGMNVGNEYFRIDPRTPHGNWRDQDVIVKGGVVQDMVAAFDRNFRYFVDIKKSRGILNTNLYWKATRSLLDKTGHVRFHFDTDPRLVERVQALAGNKLKTDFHAARSRFFQSRPRYQERYIEQAYLQLISGAKREILIANAYFVPSRAIMHALMDAARRCVAVSLISNSPQTNDLPEITMVGRGYYKTLLAVNQEPRVRQCKRPRAGMHIHEWLGRPRDEKKQREGTMHSKYAVFDRRISLVGSYNLDPRSARLNSESALVFKNPILARQLADLFEHNDLPKSDPVSLDKAEHFKHPDDIIYRLRKSFGELFEQQL